MNKIETKTLANLVMSAIFMAMLIQPFTAIAKTVQSGLVQEYNEKAKKTPLGGVELNVRSAQSTVSGKDGKFSLQFLTLNPGEKVNVRKIEKLGYEIFNKEAIEQWNINPKIPFTIVMCRSDRFKKIRDNYEKVSSESYARQLKKEEAALIKLKKQGKLKEAEYSRKLMELHENYEKQLDNLDNYIDRFSRIDLSELSEVEQSIIELVQQGKIDEAIQKYEEQNYIDKYTKEVSELQEVSSAIGQLENVKAAKEQSKDSLLAAIDRQIETLRLAGGEENYDKISNILRDVAYCDTTDYKQLYKYGVFLENQNLHNEAIESLIIAYNNCNDKPYKYKIVQNLCESYNSKSDFSLSEQLIERVMKEYPDTSDYELATLYYILGTTKYKQTQFSEAEFFLLKAIELADKLDYPDKGRYYYAISSLYRTLKKYESALDYGTKCLEYYQLFPLENYKKNIERIVQSKSNIAKIYFYSGDNSMALTFFTDLLKDYKSLFTENPTKFARDYGWTMYLLSKVYEKIDDYPRALEVLNPAMEIYDKLYLKYPTAYGKDYVQLLEHNGVVLTRMDKSNDAFPYFDKASYISQILYEYDENAFRPLYLKNRYTSAFRYLNSNQYEKSIDNNLIALNLIEPLFNSNQVAYGSMYSSIMIHLGLAYQYMEQLDISLGYFEKSLACRKNLFEEHRGITELELAEIYHYMGSILSDKEQFTDAISYYNYAYDIYEPISRTTPHYKLHASSMQRDIASIYSNALENYSEAHKSIDKAIAFFPEKISILEQKGKIYISEGDIENASIILNKILELDSEYDLSKSDLAKSISENNAHL